MLPYQALAANWEQMTYHRILCRSESSTFNQRLLGRRNPC